MITQDQGLTGLGAIVGGGGLSAIIVAVMAFLTEARKGRKPSDGNVTLSIGDGLKSKWDEACSDHLAAISIALARFAAVYEFEAERRYEGKDFQRQIDSIAMAKFIRDLKEHEKHGERS